MNNEFRDNSGQTVEFEELRYFRSGFYCVAQLALPPGTRARIEQNKHLFQNQLGNENDGPAKFNAYRKCGAYLQDRGDKPALQYFGAKQRDNSRFLWESHYYTNGAPCDPKADEPMIQIFYPGSNKLMMAKTSDGNRWLSEEELQKLNNTPLQFGNYAVA